jgi:exosortase/archaeosortase family protein
MSLPASSNGVPYLPDSYSVSEPPPRPWPAWIRIAIFVVCYAALQGLYAQCSGTAVERFFLVDAGSQSAAAVMDALQPALGAQAVGSRITAPGGGGINIGNGCEGTDIYFLLVAAFAAVAMPWRHKAIGLGLGLMLAFFLNQARIIALFHAYRSDHALFDMLHTTLAPVLLIIAIALYFHAWLRYSQPPAKIAA